MLQRYARHTFCIYTCCIVIAFIVNGCSSSQHVVHHSSGNYPSKTTGVKEKPSRKAAPYRNTNLTGKRKRMLRHKYAAMMHISPKSVKNYKLYNLIDDWYGVPYRSGGNDMNGIDCSGWVKQVYTRVYNKEVPRTAAPQYDASKHKRKVKKLSEGDLVFFNVKGDKLAHVGVYLQNHYFVHASSSKGIMISNLDEPYWKHSYHKGGKIKK